MRQPVPARASGSPTSSSCPPAALVADAFARGHPDVPLLEHAMDSVTQLNALLEHRLDVAILRVTPRMSVAHPTGLAPPAAAPRALGPGRAAREDPRTQRRRSTKPRSTSSADPPQSGTYNALRPVPHRARARPRAHDELARHPRRLQPLPRPRQPGAGTPSHTSSSSATPRCTSRPACPMHWPEEVQPYYPWSLAWRDDDALGHHAEPARGRRARSPASTAGSTSNAPTPRRHHPGCHPTTRRERTTSGRRVRRAAPRHGSGRGRVRVRTTTSG